MKTLSGKVALVTGASSGLGAATALKFAEYGARLVLAARREDKGNAVLERVRQSGAEGIFVPTDVTQKQDLEALIAACIETYGRLDCAVNNAGISGPVMIPTAEIADDDWDAVINTNLRAVWQCMKFEIPAMLQNGGGSIVNVSSIYGYKPSDVGHAAYCTSKFGVIGLSKTAAVDYGQQGIRVNVVAPGYTHSEMVDPAAAEMPEAVATVVSRYSAMNRLGNSEETGEAITWLCSDHASFVNGAVLAADGGDTSRIY
jgi:NAD(P)-dependent dehydrogenase (short-subunit alcohol dehydrogenase family)